MKNQGFSILELIVILAITSIVTGSLIFSIGTISKADTKRAAATINDALTKLRMESMAKEGQLCITISKEPDGYYWIKSYKYEESTSSWNEYASSKRLGMRYTIEYKPVNIDSQNIDIETLGISDTLISLSNESLTTGVEIGETPVIIRFNKSSGAVLNGAGEFHIISGSHSNVVKLIELTGTHFYE